MIQTGHTERLESMQHEQTAKRKLRVAVLNTHPIQYFAPMYAYMTTRMPDIELTVLYCSDFSLRGAVDEGFAKPVTWDIDLLSGYQYLYLGEAATRRTPGGFWSMIVPELWRHIRSGGYDALWLHGYGYAACWVAMLAAKSIGLPVMLRGETHLALSRPSWRRFIRDTVLRRLFRSLDGLLAIGTRNREYYQAAGVPNDKIHMVPYAVDNERFEAAVSAVATRRQEYRSTMGFPEGVPVVLYASKLIERKHPHTLMYAIAKLQATGRRVALYVVGSGPMEPRLRALQVELNLDDTHFAGFLNQSELPMAYAAADIFVLASESEPWGLVVNEVMCAGLPVITSPEMGCSEDLVVDGANGFQLPPGNVDQLAAAIDAMIDNPDRMRAMGRRSLEIIRQWGYEQCTHGLRQALASLPASR